VLATWKVLVSLAVVPTLWLGYALLGTYVAYLNGWFPEYQRYLPVVILWMLPSLGYAALKFGEAGMDVMK
jgi:glycerol-3-phosphate O-acyltransferase/dihydroxyacetone phosphate acyltransferase